MIKSGENYGGGLFPPPAFEGVDKVVSFFLKMKSLQFQNKTSGRLIPT